MSGSSCRWRHLSAAASAWPRAIPRGRSRPRFSALCDTPASNMGSLVRTIQDVKGHEFECVARSGVGPGPSHSRQVRDAGRCPRREACRGRRRSRANHWCTTWPVASTARIPPSRSPPRARRPAGAPRRWRRSEVHIHRLAEIREVLGITYQLLVESVGIDQRRVSQIEGGELEHTEAATLRRYFRELGSEVQVLFGPSTNDSRSPGQRRSRVTRSNADLGTWIVCPPRLRGTLQT